MDSTVDKLYSDYTSTLSKINLTPETIPKMREIIEQSKAIKAIKDAKKKKKNGKKSNYTFLYSLFLSIVIEEEKPFNPYYT